MKLKDIINRYTYDPNSGLFTVNDTGEVANNTDAYGYIVLKHKGKRILAHRAAWLIYYGCIIEKEIDHINGIPSDNRISNLRNVSHQENHKNRKKPKHNTSGIIGVRYDKDRKKWRAEIVVNGKNINLGRFTDINEAIKVREEASIKYGFHKNHGRDGR